MDLSVRAPARSVPGMSHHTRVSRALIERGFAVGTSITIVDPASVAIAAAAGFDVVQVDGEHAAVGDDRWRAIAAVAAARDITVLARVPDHSVGTLQHALATGVSGVIVPHVSTRAEAEAAVQGVYYPPLGRRGLGGQEPWHEISPAVDAAARIERDNERLQLWVIIETVEGVDNLAEILNVPGITAVLPGPFDLSAELGVPGQVQHPLVREQLARIVATTREAGVPLVGSHTSEPGGAAASYRAGARILLAPSDGAVLAAGHRRHREEVLAAVEASA